MSGFSGSQDTLLEEIIHQEQAQGGAHLRDAEVVDYHEQRLGPKEQSAAREHLMRCPECRHLLLALGDTAGDVASAPTPAEPTREALAEFHAKARTARTGLPTRSPPIGWWKIAAVVLATSNLLLLGWISLREPPPTAVAGNLLIEDIYPIDDPWRDGSATVIQLNPEVEQIGFLLHLGSEAASSRREIQLLNSAGDVLWRSESLTVDAHGIASVAVPAELLPAARYRLRLGRDSGQEFAVTIETSPQP